MTRQEVGDVHSVAWTKISSSSIFTVFFPCHKRFIAWPLKFRCSSLTYSALLWLRAEYHVSISQSETLSEANVGDASTFSPLANMLACICITVAIDTCPARRLASKATHHGITKARSSGRYEIPSRDYAVETVSHGLHHSLRYN